MKKKYIIGFLCLALGACLLWDLNVALGVFLVALGVSALVEVYTANANPKYELTAIEGTFRATAKGNDREQVQRDLECALRARRKSLT